MLHSSFLLSLLFQKTLDTVGFAGKFSQNWKKDDPCILQTVRQWIKLSNSFYGTCITSLQTHRKCSIRKGNYRSKLFRNT